MIVLENGHWRSERTAEEERVLYRAQVAASTPEEIASAQEIMAEYEATGASPKADVVAESLWETMPVPISEWLDDPNLAGETASSLRPQLRKDMEELFAEPFFSPRYHEIIITGALGTGKTFFTSLCIMRICYELLCLKCPQTAFGLSPSDPLYIIPVSRTKELARRVAFGQIAGKLNLSPFFRNRMRETKEEIAFPEKRVFIIGGSSNESHALGMNVIVAFVDEGNFFGEKAGGAQGLALRRNEDDAGSYDKAQVVYDALARRIKSRFEAVNVSGMIFLVSSKRGMNDFTERRIRSWQKAETIIERATVFVRDYPSWGVVPEAYVNSRWYRMAFDQKTGRSRYLEDDEVPFEDEILLDFPEEFKGHFDRDAMGAAQDYGGISFEAADTFMSNHAAIDMMMKPGMTHPFPSHQWRTDQNLKVLWDDLIEPGLRDMRPVCCPNSVRHVHIDLSKNQCATGFCMAHRAGSVRVYRTHPETREQILEEAPVYHIDFVLRIVAPPAGEIDHQHVRSLVYVMMENGINVRSVSMDHWCFVPNAQQLRKNGLKTEELSTVKKPDPFLHLRTAIYEGRVHSPIYPHLKKELKGLIPDPKKPTKITNMAGVSKDLADAVAGCLYYLAEKAPMAAPFAPTKGVSAPHRQQTSGYRPGGELIWSDEKRPQDKDDDDLPCYIVI